MNLYLFRGLPGSGKTTAAKALCDTVFSADDFFTDDDGVYNFDASKIKDAHADCRYRTEMALAQDADVAVANTFTEEWEMAPYFGLAKVYGARVFTFVVENRHGGQNVHDVPQHVIDRMGDRFEIIL